MLEVEGVEVLQVLAAIIWILLDIGEKDAQDVFRPQRVLLMQLVKVAVLVRRINSVTFKRKRAA